MGVLDPSSHRDSRFGKHSLVVGRCQFTDRIGGISTQTLVGNPIFGRLQGEGLEGLGRQTPESYAGSRQKEEGRKAEYRAEGDRETKRKLITSRDDRSSRRRRRSRARGQESDAIPVSFESSERVRSIS